MDRKLTEALRELRDDPIALFSALFPHTHTLAPHQREAFRALERYPFCWIQWPRGSSKSWTTAAWLLTHLLRYPKRKAVISGPSYRQAKILYRHVRDIIFEGSLFPWQDLLLKPPTESSIESLMRFRNGATLTAFPSSGVKLLGSRAHVMVFTEFAEYSGELYRRIFMGMGAQKQPGLRNRMVYETTAGYQFVYAYDVLKALKKKVAQGHPDYGLVSHDYEQIVKTGFPYDEEIVEALRDIDETTYKQMFQNLWLADSGSFYILSFMLGEEIRHGEVLLKGDPKKEYVVGVDVARKHDDSAITVMEVGHSPRPVYVYAENDIKAEDLAKHILSVLNRFPTTIMIVLDYLGGGWYVRDALVKEGIIEADAPPDMAGRRLIVKFPQTPAEINEAHFSLRDAFEHGHIRIPERPDHDDPDEDRAYLEIESALKQAADVQTKTLDSGYLKFDSPRKKDKFYSMLYSYWGNRQIMKSRMANIEPIDLGEPAIESEFGQVLVMPQVGFDG